MFVSDIICFNKEDSEAELRVSDGTYFLNCYAHPIDSVEINQNVNAVYGFGCTNIVKAEEPKELIKKMPQYFSYMLTARVEDKEKSIVSIGNLIINLDEPIPNDIVKGEYVSFYVLRLDC